MFSRRSSRKAGSDMSCIFVHAGAGYHSKENERLHLAACEDACKAGMLILKNGGSAVDAVEMAIKILEDREITNAGYGSNPNVDGVVECDAIVVDHMSRSGAVGAVAQIRNPVSLARVLLDCTSQPLSLRRVPPNLLVGEGATNFAHQHGLPVLPFSYLVSPTAKSRWQKWRAELMRAERGVDNRSPPASPAEMEHDSEQSHEEAGSAEASRQKHEKQMLADMYRSGNSASPFSPQTSNTRDDTSYNLASPRSMNSGLNNARPLGSGTATPESEGYLDPIGPPGMLENAANSPFANSTQQISTTTWLSRFADAEALDGAVDAIAKEIETLHQTEPDHMDWSKSVADDTPSSMRTATEQASQLDAESPIRRLDASHPYEQHRFEREMRSATPIDPALIDRREDHITDTIGAIAVDRHGNIACAASSGGISMKHRGRVGPAALIGIGASVIPVDANDPDRTTVAAVTSGTSEHMATTFAAHAAAQRVHHPRRPRTSRPSSTTHSVHSANAHSEPVSPVSDGTDMESWPSSSSLRSSNASSSNLSTFEEPCTEGEALEAFVASDFLAHPSVRHSQSAGAIGALVVKKTLDGVWLYFAHNTDSFALASMHCEEPRPICTMSRKANDRVAAGNSGIAQGGRSMRFGRNSSGRNR